MRRRRRRLEEHRVTDVVETAKKNGKLSRKETEIQERCIRSWNLLRNYLKWVKNYKEICVFVSGWYPFSGRNLVFLLVQPKGFWYCWYLNQGCFCTILGIGMKNINRFDRYGTKLTTLLKIRGQTKKMHKKLIYKYVQ